MENNQHKHGTVYTETVIFAPPEQYAADAPYQLAIIDIAGRGRTTVRILTNESRDRVRIGDTVVFAEEKNGVAYYRRSDTEPVNTSQTIRPLA